MKPELKERWIADLEGEYADKKGREMLCDAYGHMCCLGVLAEINGDLSKHTLLDDRFALEEGRYLKGDPSFKERFIQIPDGKYGISLHHINELMEINDNSTTFAPVIEYIRENL